ncbi:MAG: imidazole glycerol phosphate synthase subunit HisH [Candidatus Omnitrophica bacterium]|nr:imidazole glycerol phosphate synthase subunit HisH [Candidatus Omnitrophota bacterium]
MVVIVDYGLGNLMSVLGAVKRLGHEVSVSRDLDQIRNADRLILPGVGAFGDGMKNLHELGLIDPLNEAVLGQKIPVLGICLGCQLMAQESWEFGHHQGLGWVKGSVIKLEVSDKGLKVPHVGWNALSQAKPDVLYRAIPDESLFYFVHSFHLKCAEDVVTGVCEYGERFTAAFHKDNIFGTQFHPEKSQLYGLELLKNFLAGDDHAA